MNTCEKRLVDLTIYGQLKEVTMPFTDLEIKKAVIDQLAWDSRITQADFDVEVRNNEVTLKGTVPTFFARQAAEADVLQVPGVVHIHDETVVKYPGNAEIPPNEEIRASILNRFLWNPNIPASRIDVKVEDGGAATLTGDVDTFWKKLRAEEVAYDVTGVTMVHNELTVVPTHTYEDRAIANDISSALQRTEQLDLEKINIEVENGMVALYGKVSNLSEMHAVYHAVRYTNGVTDIKNFMEVKQ